MRGTCTKTDANHLVHKLPPITYRSISFWVPMMSLLVQTTEIFLYWPSISICRRKCSPSRSLAVLLVTARVISATISTCDSFFIFWKLITIASIEEDCSGWCWLDVRPNGPTSTKVIFHSYLCHTTIQQCDVFRKRQHQITEKIHNNARDWSLRSMFQFPCKIAVLLTGAG